IRRSIGMHIALSMARAVFYGAFDQETRMDLTQLKYFGMDVEYPYKRHHENYIGGKWVPPGSGNYFDNVSPITGDTFCEVPRSDAADVELALDAAHAARKQWGEASTTERSNVLLRIADKMEQL